MLISPHVAATSENASRGVRRNAPPRPTSQSGSPDSFRSSEPEMKAPTYGKVIREAVVGTVKSLGVMASGVAIPAALSTGLAGFVAGVAAQDWHLAAAGLVGGGIALGLAAAAVGAYEHARKAAPVAQPSDILGSAISRADALAKSERTEPGLNGTDLYSKTPDNAWFRGYEGETLGHMHAHAVTQRRAKEVHAREAQIQRYANLGAYLLSAGGTVVAALHGQPAVAIASGLAATFFSSQAALCGSTRRTDLNDVATHRQAEIKLEEFGQRLSDGSREVS